MAPSPSRRDGGETLALLEPSLSSSVDPWAGATIPSAAAGPSSHPCRAPRAVLLPVFREANPRDGWLSSSSPGGAPAPSRSFRPVFGQIEPNETRSSPVGPAAELRVDPRWYTLAELIKDGHFQ